MQELTACNKIIRHYNRGGVPAITSCGGRDTRGRFSPIKGTLCGRESVRGWRESPSLSSYEENLMRAEKHEGVRLFSVCAWLIAPAPRM